jgi:hypothetical protein
MPCRRRSIVVTRMFDSPASNFWSVLMFRSARPARTSSVILRDIRARLRLTPIIRRRALVSTDVFMRHVMPYFSLQCHAMLCG